MLLCSTHYKDWDLKEEMQGWDVDDERIAKLTAMDEEAKTRARRQLKSLFEPEGRAKFLTESEVSSHLTCPTSPELSSSLVV